MAEPLTLLEEQLIRASLDNRTDQEISDLIERPQDEVRMIIEEILGEAAATRNENIVSSRNVKSVVKVKKEKPVIEKKKEISRDAQLKQQRRSQDQMRAQSKFEQSLRSQNRVFKSKHVDYDTMRSVKVNRSTYIWVGPDVTDKQALEKYQQNQKLYKKNFLSVNR